jgi:serine/threonine-protein kinase
VDRRSSERLEESTRLGSYEIIRKLARGGMAELFLARGSDGLVVLKKILPKHADSPRFLQLFLDEARLAGSLDHPNIVRVFGADRDGGTAFFAMEYLHGQDVRTVLHRAWTFREQVPIEHAIHIGARVAAALHHAHEQRRPDGTLLQIVHRDVSPSNIFLCQQAGLVDFPKVLDFGLAKVTERQMKPGSMILTQEGMVFGTPEFMSPEQAQGRTLDARSDIYSLAIILYEALTGKLPFSARTAMEYIQKHVTEPIIPLNQRVQGRTFAPELEKILEKATAKNPDDRFQTAAELGAALRELCPPGSVGYSPSRQGASLAAAAAAAIPAAPVDKPRSGPGAALLVGVAAACLVAGVVLAVVVMQLLGR